MKFITKLYDWYGKKTVWTVFGVILILIITGTIVAKSSESDSPTKEQLPTVIVGVAGDQSENSVTRLVGTVKALNQAEITSEVSGRVTSVRVALGDTVGAGQVIATLDNALEQAAVLQAEGVYEAAVAASAQSTISVGEATTNLTNTENAAITTYRGSYTTASGIIRTLVDQLFADPQFGINPGLKIDGGGSTQYLNNERIAFRTILVDWQTDANQITTSDDIVAALNEADGYLVRLSQMIDTFSTLVVREKEKTSSQFTADELSGFVTSFNSARTTVDSTRSGISNAKASIQNAKDALEKAKIGSAGSTEVSAADAQVKQALGALRIAQANLEKTVLRTPIAGQVNSLTVDPGDFVGAQSSVAQVANNSGLIITTYVGEKDRDQISVGDEVTIETSLTGTITQIASAVDPQTRKIEVKIATEATNLASGDTVTIGIKNSAQTNGAIERLFVPITAVKFTESDGVVFTVENDELVAHDIEIGDISGSYVEITYGISADTLIVLDARGRAPGQKVEAITK